VTAVDLTRNFKLVIADSDCDMLMVMLTCCIDAAHDTAVIGSQVTRTMRTRLSGKSSVADAVRQKYVWYECDDDSVTTLTQDKFLLKLKNSQNFTPYLLFYTKCYR